MAKPHSRVATNEANNKTSKYILFDYFIYSINGRRPVDHDLTTNGRTKVVVASPLNKYLSIFALFTTPSCPAARGPRPEVVVVKANIQTCGFATFTSTK